MGKNLLRLGNGGNAFKMLIEEFRLFLRIRSIVVSFDIRFYLLCVCYCV